MRRWDGQSAGLVQRVTVWASRAQNHMNRARTPRLENPHPVEIEEEAASGTPAGLALLRDRARQGLTLPARLFLVSHKTTALRPPELPRRWAYQAARSNATMAATAASIFRGLPFLSLLTRSPSGVALATQLPI